MSSIKYPLQIANGDVALAADAKVVGEAILSSLNTYKGERVYRPSYGVSTNELTTMQGIDGTLLLIESALEVDCVEYEPLAVAVKGTIDDDGLADVTVYYSTENITATVKTVVG